MIGSEASRPMDIDSDAKQALIRAQLGEFGFDLMRAPGSLVGLCGIVEKARNS